MVTFVFFLLNHTKFFMLMMLVCLCLLQDALSAMTGVAHHINEMKRQHEQAVHVQVKKLHFLMLNFSEVIKQSISELLQAFVSRQSEAICEAIDMKMFFYSHANQTPFHKRGFALSLILKMNVLGMWKQPIILVNRKKKIQTYGNEKNSGKIKCNVSILFSFYAFVCQTR